jgi:hypothetical protein
MTIEPTTNIRQSISAARQRQPQRETLQFKGAKLSQEAHMNPNNVSED